MTIQERKAGQVAIIDVEGRLTHSSRAIMRAMASDLLARGHCQLILNLRRVEYIDSAGLGELVETYTTMNRAGGALKLVHVNPRVRTPLSLTGLLTFLEVFDSEADAVASFQTAVSTEHATCDLTPIVAP